MRLHHHTLNTSDPAGRTSGRVMNLGWRYDAMHSALNLLFGGKLRGMLDRALEVADLQPGERVLDVGCGTGTLALRAAEAVGRHGYVAGVDPGPRQVARARAKAARRGLAADFSVGVVERLPYPRASFDLVLGTLMMHHLPDDLKRTGMAEIARVLVPGGRLVIVDFARPEPNGGRARPLGAGALGIQDYPALLSDLGYARIAVGDLPAPRLMGVRGAGYVVARTREAAA